MNAAWTPTIPQIKEVFTSAVNQAGGHVTDTYADEQRLYMRSVLPGVREVKAGDGLQGGAALRVAESEIEIHPYVFRQVCRNGAVVLAGLETRRFERLSGDEAWKNPDILPELAETVHACCSAETFANNTEQMRLSARATSFMNVMPLLADLPPDVVVQILERFDKDRSRSVYALMNAVTSVARDTRDPERRWRLEELGGGMLARLEPVLQPDDAAAMIRDLILD